MSIPYIIILSDSEDEDEPMPDASIPSDSNESHDSNSVEEDPFEEEVGPKNPPLSPVHMPHNASGPHTNCRPGKSIAMSHQRMNPSPEPTPPSTDPYLVARPWNWLPITLQEWREEEKIPAITEVGESSTAPQNFPFTKEPPHHTVPLLVTRAIRHEDRLDHIEDALEAIPGMEVMEEVHDQLSNHGNHIEGVRDVTENLIQRAEEGAYRTADLEERMERIENRMDQLRQGTMRGDIRNAALEGRMGRRMDEIETRLEQLDTLVNTLRNYSASIPKGGHIPKK